MASKEKGIPGRSGLIAWETVDLTWGHEHPDHEHIHRAVSRT